MTDYTKWIAEAQGFYAELDANNSKAWWEENKSIYTDKLKAPALGLIDALTPMLSELADAPITGKLFRPHRDVRFSKDKTPYKTHIHMMWQVNAGAPQNPVFFFGIGLDYVTTGAGMMGFEKPMLDDWRKFVDLDTKRILGITDGLKSEGFTFREPALKRIPSGFAADHAAGDLLRMKGCIASQELRERDDLPNAVAGRFKTLWPLNALLIQIAES